MKYNEDKILKEIGDYIKSTYGQHYSTGKDGFQVQDLFKTLGIGKDFCHANAIKYLCRYGKKNGQILNTFSSQSNYYREENKGW